MKVRALYFASAREAAGLREEVLDLPEGADAAAAAHAMGLAHPAMARVLPAARLAVNRRFATPGQVLRPGDEVAVIPPVSGG
ncbi:MAG: molybdopterin converting factor subunit 1 [Planctomycetes bacterium]|nr:molybdopterin converting factor subunit 1 [Planctomycetota bacterium]